MLSNACSVDTRQKQISASFGSYGEDQASLRKRVLYSPFKILFGRNYLVVLISRQQTKLIIEA